jgi:[acyl-carrier-protein] S-malonyltransferase
MGREMGKIALLFPGQGAQYSGMGRELYETSPAAAEVFESAERLRPAPWSSAFQGRRRSLR